MSRHDFDFSGTRLTALASGALWWQSAELMAVSDLHLGKSERHARRTGGLLPPYETADTLNRLDDLIGQFDPRVVICLGDSFDDIAAGAMLPSTVRDRLSRMQAGRRWIWIEGNHDPGPVELGGSHLATFSMGPLTFRHIATPAGSGEISGHFHPKATIRTRLGTVTRPSFLVDADRIILPAFGTYTGGLRTDDATLSRLMGPGALAITTGRRALAFPMPRRADA